MTKLSDFCKANGLRMNTNLGQHFLSDESILEQIVQVADIQPGETVIEIGPGIGVLTSELIDAQAQVTAIEIDSRLIPLLKKYIIGDHGDLSGLTVVEGNALHTTMPSESYKVVANIPYHITSPLLRHVFLESQLTPTSLTLLIQREVAEKICDTSHAGMLTILVALFGTPEIVCHVPPSCFLPPPKVDSSVIHITTHQTPIADRDVIEQIFKLTKLAFSQKRKKISNSLGKQSGGMELLEKASIDPNRRPETLQIDEWLALATHSS